jgi:hypothetical protein
VLQRLGTCFLLRGERTPLSQLGFHLDADLLPSAGLLADLAKLGCLSNFIQLYLFAVQFAFNFVKKFKKNQI